MNQEIDKILDTALATAREIKANIGSSNLSAGEIDSLLDTAFKAELQAYKIKLRLELHLLSKSHPDTSPRDVLMKMLSLLPSDIPKSFLPVLSEYMVNEWEVKRGKIAA